ncbi:MAG: ComEC/Rec2 family competence protein [Parachlamydiaceae bacterium]|nr:ComEC/Rec2 family competence protein [Parachlamydiaceae bacterium]
MKTLLLNFWHKNPAFLYGLAALIGASGALYSLHILILPFAILCLSLIFNWRRLFLMCAVASGTFVYTGTLYQNPALPEEGVVGIADVSFSSISESSTHFGKRWMYKGIILQFDGEDHHYQRLPITLTLPVKKEVQRPEANHSYRIKGRLKSRGSGRYLFIPSKGEPWFPLVGTWSAAEGRFQAKQTIAHYIQRHIADRRVATFLAGVTTGDFDDKLMTVEFGRFGLQHIMAISGFHFAITASVFGFFLRFLLGRQAATICLIFLLTLYCLFLGGSASVVRAWMMVLIILCGLALRRSGGSGINALGLALFILVLWDPINVTGLGFQFSFVTTAAILLLFETLDHCLGDVFTQRYLFETVRMDKWNQHAYCILTGFRQALALTLAVNVVALPMTLFYFQKFPLLSLLYNLFFPFLVSISMLLLIIGLMLFMIPGISAIVHLINTHYTHFVLSFTQSMPPQVDIVWYVPEFSAVWVIGYLSLLLVLGILLKECLSNNNIKIKLFIFS